MLILDVDDDLLRALDTKKWGMPLALGTVVREAMDGRQMIPVKEYMAAKESIYRRSWIPSPWSVLSWGLRQTGFTGGATGEDKLPNMKVVILKNVEEAGKEVLKRMAEQHSRVDRIYSKQMFHQEHEDVLGDSTRISHQDLEILLKHLTRDKGEAAYDGQTIKFRAKTDTLPPIITQEDATIASLKTLIIDLEGQISSISEKVDKLSQQARDAVARKNTVAAKSALRSKKLAEAHLTKQLTVFGQLEEVYTKIEQAADQVELVRIMQGSTGVLKSLNKEVGGIERVDDVVDQLKEEMIKVDEVGGVIAEVGQAVAIDESEVDDELEALEAQQKQKTDAVERVKREEREKVNAQETKRKFKELEQMEKDARVMDESREKKQKENERSMPEMEMEESIQGLQRLSM